MTYVVNGKKIDASVGALAICIQLLEALSDKEENKLCSCGSGLSTKVCRNNTSEPKEEECTCDIYCHNGVHMNNCAYKPHHIGKAEKKIYTCSNYHNSRDEVPCLECKEEPKQEEWTDCILCARDKGHIMGNPKVFEGIEHTCTPKQEKCKWCKAGIPENCAEQSDLAETVARLDKQALKDSEMHEIEIPGPTYSDKEECDCKEKSCKPDCTTKHTCHVYSCEKCKPKQSTSLKEEIIETIWTAHGQSAIVPNTADKILSLLQSHLIKEIPEEKDVKILGQTWEGKLSAANNCGYNQSREDIIKIINNITN